MQRTRRFVLLHESDGSWKSDIGSSRIPEVHRECYAPTNLIELFFSSELWKDFRR